MTLPKAFSAWISIPFFLVLSCTFQATAQTVVPLYPDKIPNAINGPDEETNKDQVIRKVSKPTLTVFLPPVATANGSAVIVCPGGGYGVLVMEWEGYRIAKELNQSGIAAIILKYRLPDEKIMKDKSIGPLQDAQQAIKTVRERAKEWKIDPAKIGIMGFSAGGHLAATAGTHYDSTFISNPEKTSLRPDFMILVYPVISLMDKIGHKGSSSNLLGSSPTTEKVKYFSNELQVKKTTPPAFLTHAGDDTVVPVSNSIKFYEALNANGVPADMHIYSKGEHGYPKTPELSEWFGRCLHWMQVNQFLPSK
ncbi:alpha/beta hydrolase [Dyadobacter sp. CY347]|uniref:alpha/beta hydrolase n=1 Tax=Dyadobacter sp. CY347 TaxID=2909336 RepID=UPI001F2439DA|nr:alpha/beta hydrolase [Dyadobacter sp. CY347]MCF2489561.1 alpha/beta hydrolase [Dyadobacter sp. CY347]